jgi:hypothetical protein
MGTGPTIPRCIRNNNTRRINRRAGDLANRQANTPQTPGKHNNV